MCGLSKKKFTSKRRTRRNEKKKKGRSVLGFSERLVEEVSQPNFLSGKFHLPALVSRAKETRKKKKKSGRAPEEVGTVRYGEDPCPSV